MEKVWESELQTPDRVYKTHRKINILAFNICKKCRLMDKMYIKWSRGRKFWNIEREQLALEREQKATPADGGKGQCVPGNE